MFSQLSPHAVAQLSTIAKKSSYPQGTMLFWAGEMPSALLFIREGQIAIVKHDAQGNEIPMAILSAGQMVGEMAHFEGVPYPASARAHSDVVVLEIAFEAFRRDFLTLPDVALSIISSLTRKIKRLEYLIDSTMVDDAATRVGRYLLAHEARLPTLTQRTIAQELRLAPETVSRIIATLKKEHLVDVVRKKLCLIDREALQKRLA
ncbi:MAG: hypothetical protein KU37_02795 [Sulfuricurvum sp. PC08-66]|nr:MAG: hypothetical protein KU37_02795 [Sulfuricurvum sp. PC08-66]